MATAQDESLSFTPYKVLPKLPLDSFLDFSSYNLASIFVHKIQTQQVEKNSIY